MFEKVINFILNFTHYKKDKIIFKGSDKND